MRAFNTAALDPIFWVHHCNIDRLWSVWQGRDPGHLNPVESQWLTAISFEFHDANGNEISMNSSQVVNTTAAPLLYQYEDVSDPLGALPIALAEPVRRLDMPDRPIPEMVGATEQPLTLTGETATTSLPVSQPTGPASLTGEASAVPPRVFLNIENITSSGRPDGYLVYVNVPPGSNPDDHPELCAGLLPMFGVAESTRNTEEHPGNGLHYTLDITDVVRTLEAKNAWNASEMRVTFVPQMESEGEEHGLVAASAPAVHVGRVSLYYS